MLTLRLNTYDDHEIAELRAALKIALDITSCPSNVGCRKCPIRHLCYDLNQGIEYCTKQLEEGKQK